MLARSLLLACLVSFSMALACARQARVAVLPTSPPLGGARWVTTWAASPQPADGDEALALDGQTIREVVHVSLGGPRLRVRLSNLYGEGSLHVASAHVALRTAGSSIAALTDRVLTFGGNPSVVIPKGGAVVSDPAAVDVGLASDLAISLYLPDRQRVTTEHGTAQATSFVAAAPGDLTASSTLSAPKTTASWYVVTGVEVLAPGDARTIVALGDSLTDGAQSTVDANARWPDFLAHRLDAGAEPRFGVANAGISGNQLLGELVGEPMTARFDRDVLEQSGVGYVVVTAGLNDRDATPDAIIAGMRGLVARAHARSVVAVGGTLPPCEGTQYPVLCGDPQNPTRQAVNAWIRAGGVFDAMVDFDRVLRDPAHPARLRPDYDSGDHTHPNDAGYRAMGEAFDLSIFSRR